MAEQLGRLWRTVRWLKAEQILGRVRIKLVRPRPDMSATPPLRAAAGTWVMPPQREPSLVGPLRMRFLGEEHGLADVGWDNPTVALLWRYNLHYFDDLNAVDARSRHEWQRALVRQWLEDNPPGHGTGWSPYPVSLRTVNWIKWFLAGEPPEPAWLHSLAVQARWLTRRLEWHLLGNHLFANAKALVFAGLYFDGAEAESWLDTGLRILRRELAEQILADGGQFERTPMYHSLALEDLLDLLNIITARAPSDLAAQLASQLRERCGAMLYWLRCMRHPGGALVRFNDCAEGIAPTADALAHYAGDLGVSAQQTVGEGVLWLEPTGYIRVARGPMVAFLDVAPIGPDYLPGHAHADTLSFELSLAGRELVVNRGTSVYGTGARRQWERSTVAHTTVQVGEHDSSEVWAGFRVGRRARPGPTRVDDWVVESSHDGYAHLTGAPHHCRRWRFQADGLVVEDRIESLRESATAHFHIAPGLALEQGSANEWRVRDGATTFARIRVAHGTAEQRTTLHAQRFGALVEASTLAVRLETGSATVMFSWSV